MPRIVINHNDSLMINNNQLSVRNAPGTSATIKSDGLYAEQKSGGTGAGYGDNWRSAQGIESGITSPYNADPYPRRIVSPSITHRIFTCESDDGHDISIRACDSVLPGDMYRVLDTTNQVYKYYLILKTNSNVVVSSALVATIPASDPCN